MKIKISDNINYKNGGQASMEYIMVLGIIMLIFMVVMLIIYEKNSEIIETKTFLDAKRVTTSIVTNINTISVQGDGYYLYFTIPEKLQGYHNYTGSIRGNSVELTWDMLPYSWSQSPITANVNGSIIKGENKLINCNGDIKIGNSTTTVC